MGTFFGRQYPKCSLLKDPLSNRYDCVDYSPEYFGHMVKQYGEFQDYMTATIKHFLNRLKQI